jgi:HEAT repeat protein
VLQTFGDASAIEPLLAAIPPLGIGRFATLRAVLELGRTTHTPVVARVRALVGRHKDEHAIVMTGLGKLAGATWEPRALLEDTVRAGLHHDNEDVVALAVRAARALELDTLAGDVAATLGHRRWYGNALVAARDDYTAWAATGSLGAHVAMIERGIAGDDAPSATNAMHQLARAPGGAAHVALVRRALASSHCDLRCAAANALAMFGVRDACDDIVAHARSGPPEEAAAMIKALTTLADPRAVDVSLERCADVLAGAGIPSLPEPAWMCAAAVRAFGAFMTDPRAFDALVHSLSHVEMRMRRDAADAFGRAGDKRALPLLAPLLDDREQQVCSAAQRAIEALS